jgi:hypothetical protein
MKILVEIKNTNSCYLMGQVKKGSMNSLDGVQKGFRVHFIRRLRRRTPIPRIRNCYDFLEVFYVLSHIFYASV